MSRRRVATTIAAASLTALVLAACGGDNGANGDTDPDSNGAENGAADGEEVTITWWHNSNNDPGQSFYEQAAEDFMADNPGVTIEITAIAHDDMLTRLDAAFQTGDHPDIFMERGGGETASHAEAGLLRDLTEDAADTIGVVEAYTGAYTVDESVYAIPFTSGVVGFWYNQDLFDEAGISETPTTMEEFNATVDALKAADIEPVSVGAGEGWPAAHYYYYFALRACSEDAVVAAVEQHDFSDGCWVSAGENLQELIETEPFNEGFLATPAQTGPTSASGLLATEQVAMELAGHWEPGVMQGLMDDNTIPFNLGWFGFPAIDGGEGDQGAVLGGGDAWGLNAEAPDAAVDFVGYLLSDEVQIGFAENDMGLPTNPAASDSVSDEALAELLTTRDEASLVQLYFDTAFGDNVGGAMNEAVVSLFAEQASPQDVVDAMVDAAANE